VTDHRGLTVRYHAESRDGRDLSATTFFVLDPADPHAAAALALEPARALELLAATLVRKVDPITALCDAVLGPFDAHHNLFQTPEVPGAVAIPTGETDRPLAPGDPMPNLSVSDPRDQRMLLAYASSCEHNHPALAADLRRACAAPTPKGPDPMSSIVPVPATRSDPDPLQVGEAVLVHVDDPERPAPGHIGGLHQIPATGWHEPGDFERVYLVILDEPLTAAHVPNFPELVGWRAVAPERKFITRRKIPT